MNTILRRLRGAIKNGLLWAGAWALANVGISALLRVIGPKQAVPFLQAVPSLLIGGAVIGFVAGAGFSLTLAAVFRRRALEEISVASFSLAGTAIAGLLVPGLFYVPVLLSGAVVSSAEVVVNLVLAGALGGSTAFAMIKLAKAAPDSISGKEAGLVTSGDHASTESDQDVVVYKQDHDPG